jgi:DNA-binding NarL/FixJ family response regulator
MIRVLVATDDTLYRESIEAILRADEHTVVVDATPNFAAVLASVDIALLDVTSKNSRNSLADIRRFEQPPKVVAISVYDEPETVLSWIELGCSGYLSRSATANALLQAVRETHQGELIFAPRLMSAVLNRLASLADKMAPQHAPSAMLTLREKQILTLVGQGLPNKVIAARLGISHATAKNHVHHILGKLHLQCRREVTSYVLETQ